MRYFIALVIFGILTSCSKSQSDATPSGSITYRKTNVYAAFDYTSFTQTENNDKISDTLLPDIQIGYTWRTSTIYDYTIQGYARYIDIGFLPATTSPGVEFYSKFLSKNAPCQ